MKLVLVVGVVVCLVLSGSVSAQPRAGFSYTRTNLTVTFYDISTSSDNARIISWHWDFGDGNESSDRSSTHTYDEYGTYNVTLTVTDNLGRQDTMSRIVYVDLTLEAAAAVVLISIMGLLIIYASVRRKRK